MDKLKQYLNEMKAELQELYEDLDGELRNTDNQDLIDDSYRNVVSKLETALDELETLIGDIDAGAYERSIELDGLLEDEEDL
jgi:ElaB/YqjD/DUF883 family membrane-anchored ribosome-binding protein